jgi:GTP-binding protein Era
MGVKNLSRGSGHLRRHARDSSSLAQDERADGGQRRRHAREVDVVGVVIDGSESPVQGLRYLLDLLKNTKAKAILIVNKIDLVKKHKLLPVLDQLNKERDWHAIVPCLALSGDNVALSKKSSWSVSPRRGAVSGRLPDRSTRAKHGRRDGREQVLRLTRDELPFSTAVLIDKFQEPTHDDHMTRIWATILVERESQKPIVIGRGAR